MKKQSASPDVVKVSSLTTSLDEIHSAIAADPLIISNKANCYCTTLDECSAYYSSCYMDMVDFDVTPFSHALCRWSMRTGIFHVNTIHTEDVLAETPGPVIDVISWRKYGMCLRKRVGDEKRQLRWQRQETNSKKSVEIYQRKLVKELIGFVFAVL